MDDKESKSARASLPVYIVSYHDFLATQITLPYGNDRLSLKFKIFSVDVSSRLSSFRSLPDSGRPDSINGHSISTHLLIPLGRPDDVIALWIVGLSTTKHTNRRSAGGPSSFVDFLIRQLTQCSGLSSVAPSDSTSLSHPGGTRGSPLCAPGCPVGRGRFPQNLWR